MDSAPSASRMGSVDFLKGLIIIAIIGAHIILSSTGDAGAREMPLVLQIIYLGLMAFFIISGYFYRPNKGFVYNMKKRLMQLVVALVICSVVLPIILFIWLTIVGQMPDPYDIWYGFLKGMCLTDLFSEPAGATYYATCSAAVGYYYLWAMVWGFLIFYALADYIMTDVRKIIATIVILIAVNIVYIEFCCITLPFHMHMGPIAALFMFLGAFMAKYDLLGKIEHFEWKNMKYWLAIIACLAFGIAMCYVFHPGTKFDWLIFGDYGGWSVITYFLEAGSMFVVFVFICKLFSMIPVFSKIFEIAGQHTLGTLLLHGTIATMVIAPFYTITHTSWFPTEMTTVERCIVFVVTLVACILICRYGPQIVKSIKVKIKGSGSETA